MYCFVTQPIGKPDNTQDPCHPFDYFAAIQRSSFTYYYTFVCIYDSDCFRICERLCVVCLCIYVCGMSLYMCVMCLCVYVYTLYIGMRVSLYTYYWIVFEKLYSKQFSNAFFSKVFTSLAYTDNNCRFRLTAS